MNFQPNNVYHIYNQGNNRQRVFSSDEDYTLFLRMIRDTIKPHCEIIAYCLMPNHFHLMVVTDDRCSQQIQQGGNTLDPITNGIRKLLSGYARVINKRTSRTGSIFRQKTKAKSLTCEAITQDALKPNDYYANCFYYIHLNPFTAGLHKKAEDWVFSSCKEYALLRNGSLVNIEQAKKFCNYNEQTFLKEMYERKDFVFDF
jgi:putative transposase